MGLMRALGRMAAGFAERRIEDATLGREQVGRRYVPGRGWVNEDHREGGALSNLANAYEGRTDRDRQQELRHSGEARRGAGLEAIAAAAGARGGFGALFADVKDHVQAQIDEARAEREEAGRPEEEAHARLGIQAMAMAAAADGEIDAQEQARLMAAVEGEGPEARAFVADALRDPPTIEAFAATVPDDPALRAHLLALAAGAIDVDTAAERDFLDRLATALAPDAS
ncbi:MAG: DUF533 domain-containing protein [Hasllibacter sp.]